MASDEHLIISLANVQSIKLLFETFQVLLKVAQLKISSDPQILSISYVYKNLDSISLNKI